MAGFVVHALIYIAGAVLQHLLRSRPAIDAPSPAGLEDFNFPEIGEGKPVPWIGGTVELTGSSLVWYGDLDVQPREGFNRYNLGMQLVLCSGPIDELVAIKFGDTYTTDVTISVDPGKWTQWAFDDRFLFGGDTEEGGVVGDVRVYHGGDTQDPDDYLEGVLGQDLPAYRGLCYAVIRGAYLGTTPYLQPVSFIVRRCPNPAELALSQATIDGYDANPAALLFDILTAPPRKNGMGLSVGLIDVDAFRAAGEALITEGFGLSMAQTATTTAKDMVIEILRHIDAVMYVEPTNGLVTLKLIRFDYDPNTLPVLDQSNCRVKSFHRPAWAELRNTIRVKFIHRRTVTQFVEKVATAQDIAAVQRMGGQVVSQDFEFKGISSPVVAQRIVSRLLKALGFVLGDPVIEVNRVGWAFRPGTVFKLNWPPLGISGLICRVVSGTTGTLTNGKIEIDATEDVYGIDWAVYTPPPESGWVDPSADVPELIAVAGYEAPYTQDLQFVSSQQKAVALAARGQGVTLGFNLYRKLIGGTWETKSIPCLQFTPAGLLAAGLDELSSSLVVSEGPDTRSIETKTDGEFAEGANLLWIDDGSGYGEFIAFKTAVQGSGSLTLSDIARGCIDTLPKAHLAGVRVWFVSYGSNWGSLNSPVSPATEENTDLRFQAYNAHDEIDFALAPIATVKGIRPSRWDRPYCAHEVELNGASYPATISGELTVSWSHRNRLDVWSYATAGRTTWPEPGTTYEITIWDETGALARTVTALTGTSWTYLEADEIADLGLGRLNTHLKIRLETKVSAYAIEYFEWEVDRP